MPEYIERETALEALRNAAEYYSHIDDCTEHSIRQCMSTIQKIPTADVVEVVYGKWVKKHKQTGGFRRYTGVDDMGEQHTITVDERAEFDDLYCSECGKQSADNFLNFCPNCGCKMDLEE